MISVTITNNTIAASVLQAILVPCTTRLSFAECCKDIYLLSILILNNINISFYLDQSYATAPNKLKQAGVKTNY